MRELNVFLSSIVFFIVVGIASCDEKIQDNELVFSYSMNGNVSDISTHHNDAVAAAEMEFGKDRFGDTLKALYMKRSKNQYLKMPPALKLWQNSWTYSIWFSLDTLPTASDDAFLLSFSNIQYYNDIYLYVDEGTANRVVAWSSNASQRINTNQVISTKTWYHAAVVYDSTFLKIYINGTLCVNSSARFTNTYTSSQYLLIGSDQPNGEGRFTGLVDDVKLYSRAFTSEEVNGLYEKECVK